ncbi:acyltransferase [Acidobacteriota bacterium]
MEYKTKGLRKVKNKLIGIFTRFIIVPSFRITLYRWMGIKIGENVFIGMDCYLDDEVPALLTIKDNVTVAFRVSLVAHDDAGTRTVAPVVLEEGCYIGTGAIVLPGVIVGKNSVVGAGAVVTRNVEENTTVMGIPAKENKS